MVMLMEVRMSDNPCRAHLSQSSLFTVSVGHVSVPSAIPRAFKKSRAALTEKDQVSHFIPSHLYTCWKALLLSRPQSCRERKVQYSRREFMCELLKIEEKAAVAYPFILRILSLDTRTNYLQHCGFVTSIHKPHSKLWFVFASQQTPMEITRASVLLHHLTEQAHGWDVPTMMQNIELTVQYTVIRSLQKATET